MPGGNGHAIGYSRCANGSRWAVTLAAFVFAVSLWPLGAAAQDNSPAKESDDFDFEHEIEVPVVVEVTAGPASELDNEDIELSNVVLSAAKGVTTVQEAPTIVTVITADDFNERGYENLEDIIDIVPGFLRLDAVNSQFPYSLARGITQGTLYLHNGLSLFEPTTNVPTMSRVMPTEIIERVETITGPGGVLWGANSFQGLVNIITKDAGDVEGGLEAGFRVGDGNGDRSVFRGYAMSGITGLFDMDIDVFTHFSVENYKGPRLQMAPHLLSSPSPAPNAPSVFGPFASSDQPRSTLFNIDGKIQIGDVTISYLYPFGERYVPLGFAGGVVREDLPEDSQLDAEGNALCSPVPARLPNGLPNPEAIADDVCSDRARVNRASQLNLFDRYISAEYRTRFADNRAGAKIRAYGIQFVRDFRQLPLWSPSRTLDGGLSIGLNLNNFRYGVTFDGDFEIGATGRVLYGAEIDRSVAPDDAGDSIQGAGRPGSIFAPIDLDRINPPCPLIPSSDQPGTAVFVPDCPLIGIFEADRTTLGAFINPQWKPLKRLTLDAGVRVQAAPNALSNANLGFDTQLLFSGAAVLNVVDEWFLKVNYAEGFRPPVFNNTNSNGTGIQIDGDPDLEVESSQAIQTEINARLYKGKNQIREVSFRANYSYTLLENLIQIASGRYFNEAPRNIHSAEFLGKLYAVGGHRVELSYTWLRSESEQRGRIFALPEHWFNIAGVFNVFDERLLATSTLRVRGAQEDPNKLFEYRDLMDPLAEGINPAFDVVVDRLPPAANLSAGLLFRATEDITVTANAFNIFNARFYQPDVFTDLEPRFEVQPNPYQDFRFTVGVVLNAPQQ